MGLTPFEGRDVISSGVEMPAASGGLHKAVVVNDLELNHGDEGAMIIWFSVKKVRFDPLGDTDALERVHVLTLTNAAPIDPESVAEILDAQKIRQEEAKGVKRLPYVGDDPDEPDEDVE
jgi:hypothetical protein